MSSEKTGSEQRRLMCPSARLIEGNLTRSLLREREREREREKEREREREREREGIEKDKKRGGEGGGGRQLMTDQKANPTRTLDEPEITGDKERLSVLQSVY